MCVYTLLLIGHTYISSTRTLRTSGTRGTRWALQKKNAVLLKFIKPSIRVHTKSRCVSYHGANITVLSLLARRPRKPLRMTRMNKQLY